MRKVFRTHSFTDEEKVAFKELRKHFPNLDKNVIRALIARGLTSVSDVQLNLYGTIKDLTHPSDMKDSAKFVNRIITLIKEGKHIVICGDYDTDGTIATIILMKCLIPLGANIDYYINDRFTDGYGLNTKSVDHIVEKFPDVNVIITVDNGISSVEGVDYCNQNGIEVLITDHHLPPKVLPNCDIIVNPQQVDCYSTNKNICGAVVAWKLMWLLYETLGRDVSFVFGLIEFACIATVGDQIPLKGDSRLIVKEGLSLLNDIPSTPIRCLLNKLSITYVNEETIGFYLSPLFNCVSRLLGKADLLIETFMSNRVDVIQENIDKIIELNELRKDMTSVQVQRAIEIVESREEIGNVIVVYDDSFTEGILGLIAPRLVELYNRPTLVMCKTDDPNVYKGSGRSINPVHLYNTMAEISDVFLGFGGHEFAAGFSISSDNLFKLESKLNEVLHQLTPNDFYKEVIIDCIVTPSELTVDTCNIFKILQPFGNSFEKPKFLLQGYKVDVAKSNANKKGSPFVGNDGSTLRLVNYDYQVVMMFKYSDVWRELGYPLDIRCVGEPTLNEYNGKVSVQFIVENDYLFI